MSADADGRDLLVGPRVGELLAAAVGLAGGRLISWRLREVDHQPGVSTTATYEVVCDFPSGPVTELFGVTTRASGPTRSDARAQLFADGARQVAVWSHPNDPDLPGLRHLVDPQAAASLLDEAEGARAGRSLGDEPLRLTLVTYRPRRRAVVRLERAGRAYYAKAMRRRSVDGVVRRHALLAQAGVPAPEVVAVPPDAVVLTRSLPGRPLVDALLVEPSPCTAEDLVDLLDRFPDAVSDLPRRPPWSDAVDHFATLVARALPEQSERLGRLAFTIAEGLADFPEGHEPTHGDFHEGQLRVAGGRVVGVLDVDTIGPGRRADDLACLLAHLSTLSGLDAVQTARVHGLIRTWVPVFDERVDPVELRLRTAGVLLSLASGPHREQAPNWRRQTIAMVNQAASLVAQVR